MGSDLGAIFSKKALAYLIFFNFKMSGFSSLLNCALKIKKNYFFSVF